MPGRWVNLKYEAYPPRAPVLESVAQEPDRDCARAARRIEAEAWRQLIARGDRRPRRSVRRVFGMGIRGRREGLSWVVARDSWPGLAWEADQPTYRLCLRLLTHDSSFHYAK